VASKAQKAIDFSDIFESNSESVSSSKSDKNKRDKNKSHKKVKNERHESPVASKAPKANELSYIYSVNDSIDVIGNSNGCLDQVKFLCFIWIYKNVKLVSKYY